MSTTTTQPVSLKISRLIKAPRERVFAAWTNANEFAQWLGGGGRKVVHASIDLRPGGEYRLKTVGGSCDIDMVGEYRDVKPPELISFTWTTGGCTPEHKGTQTLVTVELKEQKGGTLVELTHEGFPTTEMCDKHEKGWNASFEVLEKLV
ncbi:MAG: SRPBCC domain-containing protein [Methylacidiphilales bacterium]|nr:SRPBCC domain-containing protein [Candidatus Methylacidiphilales bacterium]